MLLVATVVASATTLGARGPLVVPTSNSIKPLVLKLLKLAHKGPNFSNVTRHKNCFLGTNNRP